MKLGILDSNRNLSHDLNNVLSQFNDVIITHEITENFVDNSEIIFIFVTVDQDKIIKSISEKRKKAPIVICAHSVYDFEKLTNETDSILFFMPILDNFKENKAIVLAYNDLKDKLLYTFYKKNIEDVLIAAKNRELIKCEGLYETDFLTAESYYGKMAAYLDYMKEFYNQINEENEFGCNCDELFEMLSLNL